MKKLFKEKKAITLIALIVTIIVLLILAGVTINLAVNNQGIFNKAKTATGAYKNASENEQTGLDEADKEIAKYMPKEGTEGESGSESGGGTSGSGSITYTDSSGNTKPLTKDTPTSDYGTKIGNTTITNSDNEEIKLDWYLFDVSDDGKTAYLVSTPTFWEPDTTKEVSGAWVPKLLSNVNYGDNPNSLGQAIQKQASEDSDNYKYDSNSVTYTPSANTLNYFKSANSDWAKSENGRSTQEFSKWNGNEQEACYLADADIFAGIREQVNKADGNLKGKIQTLVGGASAEQWCKAYNKQSEASSSKITCEYSTKDAPGYIYKVNDKQSTISHNDCWTGTNTILGNDIYGAANKNGSSSPFNQWWLLASPSASYSESVCYVNGDSSSLTDPGTIYIGDFFSLFASVSL